MMESARGQFLVSSRFMGALYGTAKTVVFVYLALLAAADVAWTDTNPSVTTHVYAPPLPLLHTVDLWLTVLVVGLTVLRGIPVFIEAHLFFATLSPKA